MDYLKIYTETFSNPSYSEFGDGDPKINYIDDYIKNKNPQSIIDIGSGRGFLIKHITKKFPKIELLSVDLEKFNEVNVKFMKINLSLEQDRFKLNNTKYDLLTCLDVLEHLSKSYIEYVLELISNISKVSILTIANHSDVWNGIELHTIQEDFSYWKPLLLKYFEILYYEEKYIINNNPRLYLLKLKSKYF